MSTARDGLGLLVVTGEEPLGSAIADAVEATGDTAKVERAVTATSALNQSQHRTVDGVIVDGQIEKPVTVVDRLTSEQGLPVVVLADSTGNGDTITGALEAGAIDVFPRTPTSAQCELIVERIASDAGDSSPGREGMGSDRLYRTVFGTVSDGLVVHDPGTGEILEVNERYCEMTGYSPEALVGEPIDLVMADDEGYAPEEAKGRLQRTRDTGGQRVEWRQQHADGHTFTVDAQLTLVERRGTECLLGTVRDTTGREQPGGEFDRIFDSVSDIIAVHDRTTGELLTVNQRMCEVTGYDRERLLELGVEGLIHDHPDQDYGPEEIPTIIQRVVDGEDIEPYEQALETRDGTLIWIEVNPTRAVIGDDERFVAISRDITDRRRHDRILRGLHDAIERLQKTETKDEVRQWTVQTVQDVLELPLASFWLHRRTEDGPVLEPAAATGDVRGVEGSRFVPGDAEYEAFRDGEVLVHDQIGWFPEDEVDAVLVLPVGEHGLLVAGEVGASEYNDIVVDATRTLVSHVRTALDQIEREQTVRESERRFRLIAERIDEVIYLAEPDFSEVLYVNPAYEEIYGQPVERLYDDPTAFREVIDERDKERFESNFAETVTEIEGNDPPESYEFEFRVRRPDGEVRWVNLTGYVVELSSGKHRYVGIVDDITERKRREQRLEVLNRILRHNLRNKLAVIMGHAETLAARTTGDHAEQILATVTELSEIASRARETGRITSMDNPPIEFDLAETVGEIVTEQAPRQGDVAVTTELPERAPLCTNQTAVVIAVERALENAIEHATSAVTVTIEEASDEYVITVSDDGPGIPDEELVPIEAGTETALQHGIGLGLWELRWSVDTLNGRLSFDTTEGTTVRIEIPGHRETEWPD